jgi:hypothetical protein
MIPRVYEELEKDLSFKLRSELFSFGKEKTPLLSM